MPKQRVPIDDDAGAPPEDAAAFRAAVRDVKPLALPEPPAGLQARPRRPVRAAEASRPSAADELPLVDAPDVPAVGAGDPLSFRRAGVRDQVLRRLRRGSFPIEAELDLHGLAQTHARDLLADFLERSGAAGMRCVRIVHGKGHRSGARGPVLKAAVNLWLRRRLDVMAFTSARTVDGGTGAVYVLLRAR